MNGQLFVAVFVKNASLRHLKTLPSVFSEYWLSPKTLLFLSDIPLCQNGKDQY
jgi:hypothetical protein